MLVVTMLTAKQAQFVDEYLACLNGTQAAIRAGYSAKTARAIASENLKKPEIAAAINKRRRIRLEQLGFDESRVIEELAKLAFFNIFDVMDSNYRNKPIEQWPPEALTAVGYEKKITQRKNGSVATKLSIKAPFKLEALKLLMHRLGNIPPRAGRPRKR